MNVEGAELHNMGQLTDIGIVDAKVNDFYNKTCHLYCFYISNHLDAFYMDANCRLCLHSDDSISLTLKIVEIFQCRFL